MTKNIHVTSYKGRLIAGMLLKQIDSDNVLELEKEEISLEQTAPVIETDV